MPLDNKCRIGPLAGASPDTCAVVISTETESGFITEDDTSPVCHTSSCPKVGKNPKSTLPMMWGQCNYHIAPTEVAADTSIRPTCFSEAIIRPYQSPSAARTAAGYVLEASKSQYRLSKSSDSFG
ncbi:hypothetical protein TNCV_3630831 [Trichonephila clavipes]|nr:hypothetical protein TNCV_3630831 [Trichonephila clavipes]